MCALEFNHIAKDVVTNRAMERVKSVKLEEIVDGMENVVVFFSTKDDFLIIKRFFLVPFGSDVVGGVVGGVGVGCASCAGSDRRRHDRGSIEEMVTQKLRLSHSCDSKEKQKSNFYGSR